CLNFQTDKPETLTSDKVLGIDRGIKNTIYCSDGSFVSGKARNKIKRQFTYNRKQLQAKGTRSAKRKLRLVSGREQRFGKNENHIISKQLVNSNYDIFVLEKLSNFSKKGNKSFRRRISNWSYYQLEMFLKYKAELLGKRVEYIEASYTSQRCSNCGYIDKKNRIRIDFSCQSCGFRDHADYNAAKNIIELWLSKESA